MAKCFFSIIYCSQSISGQFPNQPGGFTQGAGNYGPGFDPSATMNSGVREHYSIPVMNGSGPVSKYSSSGQSNAVPQSSSSSSLSSADGMNGNTTQSPFLPQSMSSNNESSHSSDKINGINNNTTDNNSIESLKRKTMDDDTSLHNQSNHNVTAEQ